MRELLRLRDFRLLFVGQTLSIFGDSCMILVLAMWAKKLTDSNGLAGTVLFALALPGLLAPLAGVLVDRLPRRKVMIVTDLSTAVVVLSLLFVRDRDQLWLIYLVAFCYGLSLFVFLSARSAYLQGMLDEQLLGPANGLLTTVREAMRLVGPLVGAALFALIGGGAVAVLDAATFVCSAVALFAMRSADPRPHPTESHWWPETTAGIRHIGRTPVLRHLLVATVICLLVFGFAESIGFAIVDGLGRPVEFLGVLSTIQGVGAVLAGVLTTMLIRRAGELRVVWIGLAASAVGLVFLAGYGLPPVTLGLLVFGASLPPITIGLNTTIQKRTPADLQGRTMSGFDLMTSVPYTLSIAVGAVLVGIIPFRILLLAMSCGVALSAGYAFITLRGEAGRPPPPDQAPDPAPVPLHRPPDAVPE
jgi:Na+/melibiose symporter-like transporter